MKVQELREIIRLVDQSSISELTYENNGSSITLKKQAVSSEQTNTVQQVVETNKPVQETKPQNVESSVVTKVEKEAVIVADNVEEGITEIISPMVGTFYRKPSPESDNYVEVGDNVTNDSIVCIVEAMKLFNEIEAEISGEIVEILADDGELVEYGQPLFKVKQQ